MEEQRNGWSAVAQRYAERTWGGRQRLEQLEHPSVDALGAVVRRHLAVFSFSTLGLFLAQHESERLEELEGGIAGASDEALLHLMAGDVADGGDEDEDEVGRDQEKVLASGYCAQHTVLMYEVLRALGYEVRMVTAHCVLSLPGDEAEEGATPNHAACIVQLHGEQYLVDVGLGNQSLRAPLLMVDGEQVLCRERYLVDRSEVRNQWRLSVRVKDDWLGLFHLDERENRSRAEMEKMNHDLLVKEDVVVRTFGLLTAKVTPTERKMLVYVKQAGPKGDADDMYISIHRIGQESEKESIPNWQSFRKVAQQELGVVIPPGIKGVPKD